MLTIKDFNPKPHEELGQYGKILTESYTMYPIILTEELRLGGNAKKYDRSITICTYCDNPHHASTIGEVKVCNVCVNLTFWYNPGCVRDHFI